MLTGLDHQRPLSTQASLTLANRMLGKRRLVEVPMHRTQIAKPVVLKPKGAMWF